MSKDIRFLGICQDLERSDSELADAKAEIDRLQTLYENRGKRIEELGGECERLQAIVDKLPVTADGVPVVPQIDDLYHPSRPKCGILNDETQVEFDDTGAGDWHYHPVGECYSTEEAAQAAKETS